MLGDVSIHFGDADFQHHLLAAGDTDHVDDLLGIAGKAGRQVGGAGGFHGAGDRAGQNHIVVQRLHLNGGIGHAGLHQTGQIHDILLDADIQRQDLLALASKKKALVWPTLVASRKMRRGVRTTASTKSGLDTSTSRASASSCTTAALSSGKVKR